MISSAVFAQDELVFLNPSLQSGKAGEHNSVYYSPNVKAGVDGLVNTNLTLAEGVYIVNAGCESAYNEYLKRNNISLV